MKHLAPIIVFAIFTTVSPLQQVGSRSTHPLSLDDALALALEKNSEIVVERESIFIADATLVRAQAAYEPFIRGEARLRDRTDPVNSILSGAPRGEVAPRTRSILSSASLVQLLPTGGSMSLFSTINQDRTNSVLALLTPSWSTGIGAEIRQPLMQNRRIDPARRAIRIARVDRERAASSLQRIASEIAASVERAFWTLVAARRDITIRESAVQLAEAQRKDTRIRIEAGTQAESDLSQTTAEIERRRGELVTSRELLGRAENALRSLIARDTADSLWQGAIVPDENPNRAEPSPPSINVETEIAHALDHRPELREMALRLERQDVEIESALDRVRPQLDLVAAYQGRGLAGSENDDSISPFGEPPSVPGAIRGGLGRSLGTIGENRFPDASLGFAVSLPIGNSAAKQDVAIGRALRRQAVTTLDAARQRVAVEVRNAAAALSSAAQRIEAATAAREAAVVQLQAENDRFTAGTSNNFFVFTRQNDLAAAKLAELVALTDYRKAETELARATGSLLQTRGIHIHETGGSR